MFESAHTIGVLLALGSAVAWGTGDFAGGMTTRRYSQYQVLVISGSSGLAILTALAFISGEAIPGKNSLMWSLGAGVLGGVGLAALYKGLAEGSAAVVAPTAAVVGASIPVIAGYLIQGQLETQQIIGIFLALAGIWLVTLEGKSGNGKGRKSVVTSAIAGCGFAGFLIMISMVDRESILSSLTAARLSTLLVALVMCYRSGKPIPGLVKSKLALYAGLADVMGNTLFVTAQQYTRLDVAAVVSSLYPAVTVLMAWIILRQKIMTTQWFGLLCCLAAVALIAN